MQAVTGNLKAYYSPKNIILFLTLKVIFVIVKTNYATQ